MTVRTPSEPKLRLVTAASPSAVDSGEPALHVQISFDGWVRLKGTAQQIQEEIAIPPTFQWPQDVFPNFWSAKGFTYVVGRARPKGCKGPRRSWPLFDYWECLIECHAAGGVNAKARQVARQIDDFDTYCFDCTAAGMRRSSELRERFWNSREDQAFQAFKARLPGFIPPKRKRKTKAVAPHVQR
jgi:hypothetical protein